MPFLLKGCTDGPCSDGYRVHMCNHEWLRYDWIHSEYRVTTGWQVGLSANKRNQTQNELLFFQSKKWRQAFYLSRQNILFTPECVLCLGVFPPFVLSSVMCYLSHHNNMKRFFFLVLLSPEGILTTCHHLLWETQMTKPFIFWLCLA